MKTGVIETERLVLREITEEDTNIIVEWRSNPEAYRFFKNPTPITIESHLNWYHSQYLEDSNRIDYIAIEKDNGNKIGLFGIILQDRDSVEVNYLVSPNFQCHGYATEAVYALLRFSQQIFSRSKAIVIVHKDNFASIHLAKRLLFEKSKCNECFNIYSKDLK